MKILIKHVGNMGDMIFFIPPVLETLKKNYPGCHITLVTAWGFKDKKGRWGKRNQSGYCINLMMTNPHIDQLVHWHDDKISLAARICQEGGRRFPTWNRWHYEKQKVSGKYDAVYELDFGLGVNDNPMERIYQVIGMPKENFSNYRIYTTRHDLLVAEEVMKHYPMPRIFLLEGIESTTARGWDPEKVKDLGRQICRKFGVAPLWFGGRHVPEYHGRSLTLRENIATLKFAQVGIGVLSGPCHFAASIGLPTITLYSDHILRRAAPAFFLNSYIESEAKKHRTIIGPAGDYYQMLKRSVAPEWMTAREKKRQKYLSWLQPGRQSTKSGLAVITVAEVMKVLNDVLGKKSSVT